MTDRVPLKGNYVSSGVCGQCRNALAQSKGKGWVHPLYDDLPRGECPPRGSTRKTVGGDIIRINSNDPDPRCPLALRRDQCCFDPRCGELIQD